MASTRVERFIAAPRSAVYRALIDPVMVHQWMVPDDMTSEIHTFESIEGGQFRISLTYSHLTTAGKTDSQTDTFHGHFVRLVPNSQIVQAIEFETTDPTMAGEMRITYTLTDEGDGARLVSLHEGLPPGVAPADNELGTNMSLDKLARLLESPATG